MEGAWYRQARPTDDPGELPLEKAPENRVAVLPGAGLQMADGSELAVDVVLPILHGSYGEDGTLQGLLEMARLPYAGSAVLGSAAGMDKEMTKRLWQALGLPVVSWHTLRRGTDSLADSRKLSLIIEDLGLPLFVKPANAGSSVGVSRVDAPESLKSAVEQAWQFDRKVLVEKAVAGREIECSVMGYSRPRAFPPGEIVPAGSHSFYDYEAKYIDPDGALLKVPARLPEETAGKIRKIAEQAYQAVEAGGFARVDFLLEEPGGAVFINEINTLPGLTNISLFPRMAAAGGMDFTAVLEELISGARNEFEYREGRALTH